MELIVAALLMVLGLGLMWAMQGLGKGLIRSARSKERARLQARRHLVQGTQLLARSRLREAAIEADKAISIDPKNAATHILKAFAVERQGHMASALRSLNAALSPPAVKSLSKSDKAEALLKRAEVTLAASSGGKWRLEFALKDLHASVAINPNSAKAHCLLGRCYERKGRLSEARQAFQDAVKFDPSSHEANEEFLVYANPTYCSNVTTLYCLDSTTSSVCKDKSLLQSNLEGKMCIQKPTLDCSHMHKGPTKARVCQEVISQFMEADRNILKVKISSRHESGSRERETEGESEAWKPRSMIECQKLEARAEDFGNP